MNIDEIRRAFFEQEKERRIPIPCKSIDPELVSHVLDDIVFGNPKQTPRQRIEEVAHMNRKRGTIFSGGLGYNSWPFGETTREIFPRAVGVCKIGSPNSMKATLGKMMDQSAKMARKYRNQPDVLKTVIIVTDYWDPKQFKEYEKEMLQYALKDGIWYIFLLATDYGVTQIPFLPNSRDVWGVKLLPDEMIEP